MRPQQYQLAPRCRLLVASTRATRLVLELEITSRKGAGIPDIWCRMSLNFSAIKPMEFGIEAVDMNLFYNPDGLLDHPEANLDHARSLDHT